MVVTLSLLPAGPFLPTEGVCRTASRWLHPVSGARPPVLPLLCHHHLPVPGPAHPHRECRIPMAGMGDALGGVPGWVPLSPETMLVGGGTRLSTRPARQGMTHRAGKSSRFLWPVGGRSGMGLAPASCAGAERFVSKINLLLCLWLIIKRAELSACCRLLPEPPIHPGDPNPSHDGARAPGMPSWLHPPHWSFPCSPHAAGAGRDVLSPCPGSGCARPAGRPPGHGDHLSTGCVHGRGTAAGLGSGCLWGHHILQ